MSRKIKGLGVAFVVVFALTAVSASSAFASSALTVGTGGTKISGTQKTTQKLVIGAGGTTVKCTTSTLTAAGSGTVTETTATPAYSGCTLGGVASNVVTHSCTYTLHNSETALKGTADVTNCPTSSPIEINVPSTGCSIVISNQTGLEKITYANLATTPTTVEAILGIEKITYTGNASCPANVVGSHSDGKLEGSYTLKAETSAGAQVSLSAD